MSHPLSQMGMDSLFDERPPYRVQSMAERASIPRNGLTAVSTFSGSGGSSLGLKTAGFTIPYAVEFTPQGAATYRANNPQAFVDQRDVREIQPEEILEHIGMKAGELDLFEGSPPCSSFSSVAVRSGGQYEDRVGKVKHYSEGIKQRTDDLFEQWVRLVAGLRPKAILAENVPDMAKPGSAQDYLFMIQGLLRDLGYDLHVDVHSSLGVGCATIRKRLVLTGIRRDLGVAVPRPRFTGEGYTLREALAELPVPIPEDELAFSWANQISKKGVVYDIAHHWEKCVKPGETHRAAICKLPREDGSTVGLFSLVRAHWDRPAGTFTAAGAQGPGSANIMHPDECRKFTATEIAWLSGFPADYILTGSPANRYERIGRAVVPPLYEAIGGHLAAALKSATKSA